MALLIVAASAACGPTDPDPPAFDALGVGLVPAAARINDVNARPRARLSGPVHPAPVMAERNRWGYRIARDPARWGAAEFHRNALSCFSCHMNGGQREYSLPLVGVAGLFPQYRNRDAREVSLRERIDGCFLRSMNGRPPPPDHPVALALSAYITWLESEHPADESPPWRGVNRIAPEARVAIEDLDVARGRQLYEANCQICHGADGQGVDLGVARPAPLWGPRSWNDGAGASRIWTLAGFIRYAMPLNAPGSLTDEESQHISAYINSHDRPVFPNKAADYPEGGRPADAVYDTLVFPRHPLKAARRALLPH